MKPRAFLAYLGKGRRANIDYEQLLKHASMANRRPAPRDAFLHEPLLLDARGVRKSRRILDRCFEDLKRLEATSSRATLFYLTTQLFQVESKAGNQGENSDQGTE